MSADADLYQAVALARELTSQGIPLERATKAACVAYGASPTLTARYTANALAGVAQARADLAAAGQRTEKLKAAQLRRNNGHKQQ